jgi:hypothetical protein
MRKYEDIIKQINTVLERSTARFNKGVKASERSLYLHLLEVLKDFKIRNGRLVNGIENLKKLQGLQARMERLMLTDTYLKEVEDFMKTFKILEDLNRSYFTAVMGQYKPSSTMPVIREIAMQKAANNLIGQGLAVNVAGRIQQLLQDWITSGGSYASLAERIGEDVITSDAKQGILSRYVKTVSTDAVNQYNAQVQETVAQDLNLNWARYIGGLIETSREFCKHLANKDYIHKSELPTIVTGLIDGHQVQLSRYTGLPKGMIEGTDADNFKIRRGGYNCGHQLYWVPDAVVPKALRDKFRKAS